MPLDVTAAAHLHGQPHGQLRSDQLFARKKEHCAVLVILVCRYLSCGFRLLAIRTEALLHMLAAAGLDALAGVTDEDFGHSGQNQGAEQHHKQQARQG